MSNKREKEVGKMSRFLRVFAFVIGVFFAGNVLAGGYTCPTYKVYTGCNSGYYLTGSPTSNAYDATQGKVGNACRPCSVMGQYNGVDKYTCAGGTAAPEKKTVRVIYNWNGASYRPSDQFVPQPMVEYDFGVPIDLLEDTENQYYRAGYQFRGWSTSQTATSGTFTMTFDGPTTLHAVWVPCGQGTYKPASATAAASCSSMADGYYGTGCASDGYTACTGQAQCTGTTYCQDHIKQECPDPNLAKNRRETLPAAYKGAKFASAGVESANGRTEPGQCKALIWYDPDPNATGQRVGLFEYVYLSDATMRYEGDVENWMYDAVGPGYYLTNKSACGAYAYYKQVVACPDGSYCPGKAKVTCNASNQSTVHTTDFGRMSCPGEYTHSDGARSSVNNCYLMTTAGKYVATAKENQVACNVTDPTDYYYPGGIKVYYGSTGGWKFMDLGWQNAALSGGSCANKELCPAGTWGDSAGLCSPVDAGYYPNDCQVTYLDDRPGIGCMTMESCSSLPGSPKTGTFNSPQGAKSNRECTYTPAGKSIAGCATVTPITVTYTGQSWPANIGAYAVTPKTGYVAKDNNTAAATCNPGTYTITLNATQNGGTGGWAKVYEVYNGAWYSDANDPSSLVEIGVPIPTKANSVFNGYYTAATGGTQRITKTGALPAATTFTANTTLYAQFSACAACTKGKGVKSCSASVTDNACTYSATCSNGYKNPTCDSAGKCSCTGNTFYIEYNAYGGSGPAPTAPKSCVVGSGNCYAPENTYSLTGHTFFAWRVGGQQIVRVGTELSNLFTGMADGGTLTLMAAWVPNSYTIRYIVGDAGESEYREQNVNYNATFTTMSADTFTRSGWTFAGWGGNYPKSDTQYSYTTAGDTILAANWCQNCATVSNGSCTLTVNETTGACTYDTKCNTGYYISSGAGTRAPVCSPSSYVVTYNLNGGSGTAPSAQACTPGQSCTLNAGTTTAFYRNGYVLAGWSTSQTATSGSFAITITAATTVYAVWTPCAAGTYKPTTANAAATCTTCPAGSYCPSAATTATKCPNWTYAPSSGMASCTACPTLTSGWSKANSTGTGWTSYTSCVQISPTPAGCASGNVKQTAASNGATTWAASVVNTALSANPGYRVSGTSCSICTGATYSAGGTATSCSACPTIYTSDTTNGKTKDTECKVKTDAGKYIKTAKDSVQTTCPIQTYCPSASVAYGSANSPTACPSAAEHARTTYPADYLNPTLLRITLQDWTTGMKTITDCRANYQLSNEAGNLTVESVLYNATTQKYDVNGSRYYTVLKPGWYFTERYSAVYCDTASHSMLYKNVAQCPENHYCPGYTTMPLCSSGNYTAEKGKFACSSLGTGVYTKSPAKSGPDTACYLTTTSTKFVKTAKSAPETCTAGGYCPGGVKVNWGSTGGRTPASAGYYVGGTGATSQTACAAGTYTSTTGQTSCSSAVAGTYTTGCQVMASGASTKTLACTGTSVCATNTYSSAKASACTACATAKGYTNSGTTAAAHAGLASCKTTCSGGQYVATAGAGCVTVGGGYYGPGGTIGQDGTMGRDQCPAGYRDGAAAAAKTDCKMNVAGGKYIATADDATPTSCVAGTFKAAHVVAYGSTSSCSACTGRTQYSSAGASSCSTVSTGYYTTGCNASSNNCTGQSQCSGATYCASGVQNNCPAQTSGWTRGTGNGWTSYTSCYETTEDVTSISPLCYDGQLKKTATSATAWGAPTISVALQAKPGAIVNGQTCELCSGANYSAGGTATSCTACPTAETGWTQGTGDAWSSYSSCYETQTPANCASGTVKRVAASATAYKTDVTLVTQLKSKAGYYASATATSCTICPAGSYCPASATTTTKCANWTYAPSSGMASCTACPALTSGWSKANSTGTGWTSYTSCVQISPTPAGCASGNVKQTAASNGATTWAASVVNTALSANPGYRVNGTSCSICTGATYSAGGTATSCSTCPTIYTSDTTNGKTKNTECKVKTDAGKYIAAANDSTQTTCPAKNYCPSASVAYGSANSPTACPAANSTTERTTYPADYLNVKERGHFGLQSWPSGIKAITGCMTSYSFVNEAGRFGVENVGYNTTTGKYDVGGSRYYTMLNPGWYLKDRLSSGYCNTTSNPMYYVNVVQCPENHYCPGYKTMPLCSSGEYTAEKGKNACSSLGTGVYTKSPVKSGAETACYLTTTSAKFVKTAKSAEETCTAGGYCPGGVKVNWNSTGGRNTCPTTYPSSAASSNSELDCYVTTVAGKYVATVGAGQVNCAGTGYYCPGGTNVYSGAYGSRLTTGGRTQCPVGYRDLVATASTTKEAQCAMNVAGGKYVKVAKESAASGTCAAGYAKAAHSVTYGNTSSCAECTGTTYAENTGQASCTACPTQSGVTNISYWISTGTHTDAKGCYGFYNDVALNNGSVARIQCFWDKTKSQYDTSCGAMKDGLKCNAAYYNAALESSPTNNAAYYTDKASVIAKACTSVGKGYWSPVDVYTRTQCPAGYRDGAAGVSEAQCAMNVAGGKYVKVAKESAASGTCAAGYAKAAHSVTYGNTSSCAACTGATYAASTGQASCTACPTAKTYASAVKSYGYWNNGKNGDHTISDGCYATMTGTLSNGSLTEHGCYLGTDGDYGNAGGKSCYVHQDNLKCNAGYYASTLSNGYVWNNTRAGLLSNTCVGVGAGYYSAANILTRNQCPTGLTTIGYGAGADEAGDCGRVMHMGEDKLYLRSTKKTTPSLNVKVGDTTYYGNMTSGTTKGKLRVKSGTTTYSVHDDSM